MREEVLTGFGGKGKDTDNNGSIISDAKDIRHDRIVYGEDGRRRRREGKKKNKDEDLGGWKAFVSISLGTSSWAMFRLADVLCRCFISLAVSWSREGRIEK